VKAEIDVVVEPDGLDGVVLAVGGLSIPLNLDQAETLKRELLDAIDAVEDRRRQ
jgi:hypothetical protein